MLCNTSIFSGLTFYEIFIGYDGFPVLVSSMLLALVGNLLKKWFRYNKVKQSNPFDWKRWLSENWDDMIAGGVITYILVRLLNTMSVVVFRLEVVNALIPDRDLIPVSEVLIIVSIFIGYYTDRIVEKVFGVKSGTI